MSSIDNTEIALVYSTRLGWWHLAILDKDLSLWRILSPSGEDLVPIKPADKGFDMRPVAVIDSAAVSTISDEMVKIFTDAYRTSGPYRDSVKAGMAAVLADLSPALDFTAAGPAEPTSFGSVAASGRLSGVRWARAGISFDGPAWTDGRIWRRWEEIKDPIVIFHAPYCACGAEDCPSDD